MSNQLEIAKRMREVSELFRGVPAQTRIPVPELHHVIIFGNLESGTILNEVAVDKAGRFWRHDRETDELVMFFDPHPSAIWEVLDG